MSHTEHLRLKQLIERGVSAWERSEYQAALDDFRQVLAENPQFPDIHNKAGLCYAMLGDPESALKEFDEALRLSDS